MLRTAILTSPGDVHAHAVAWTLRQKGNHCDLIYFGDLPGLSTTSYVLQDGHALVCTGVEERDLLAYDRYWLRKPADPIMPVDLHPSDRPAAKLYWNCLVDSYVRSLELVDAFCVNGPLGSEVSRLKQYQLHVARQVGLTTPRTMISNDCRHVRDFIDDNDRRGTRTIAKPLHHALWDMEDGGAATFDTSIVTRSDVSEPAIKLAPTIFQEEVQKRSEVRLTVMGGTMFAANLETQTVPSAKLDYRMADDWSIFGCHAIEVPIGVRASVLEFQRLCRLNFGTMDFIIDQEGTWTFLETNPMGQFLWVESARPETPLLDAFAEFLVSGDDAFIYEEDGGPRACLASFKAEAESATSEFLARERGRHVQRGPMTVLDARLTQPAADQ